MKNLLVASAFYPDDKGNKRLYYIHVRNKYYQSHGLHVTVLNFSANHNYVIDGIKVITLKEYKKAKKKYEILICHAANIRDHFIFLKKYGNKFSKIIFFFHGHEIMHVKNYYPKPYAFKAHHYKIKKVLRNMYDSIKLKIWRTYFLNNFKKIEFVFVSDWIKKVFLKELKLAPQKIINNSRIINNSIGKIFEDYSYDFSSEKKYDFITIRNYLDDSKYAIDIVIQNAIKHPEYNFCLIGRGKYFKFHELPHNVQLIQKELSHKEIIDFLNTSRCALMPTREDTQGVMTCEMATFGIPTITSNIEVCQEIFKNMKNVILTDINSDQTKYYAAIAQKNGKKNHEYYFENTVKKEIDMIYYFLNLKG